MPKNLDLLETPVDVERLVNRLGFDIDHIEEAAQEQPRLLLEAGRYRVIKLRRRMQKELIYERALADSRTQSRNKKNDTGRNKYTQGDANDIATKNPEVQAARKQQDEAFIQEELSKVLFECFKQRRDMLKTIATIRASEASAEVRQVRENMSKKEMENMRVRAREAADRIEDDDDEE